jgi:hypothetical protein
VTALMEAGKRVKTAMTSKYHREKGVMNKFEFRKKRRFNGSADEIIKNNHQ